MQFLDQRATSASLPGITVISGVTTCTLPAKKCCHHVIVWFS